VAQNGTNRLTRQDIGRTHFGEPVGSGSGDSANTAVPDPTSLAMLVVAAGLRIDADPSRKSHKPVSA
jgi:hypothetical protein